MKHIKKIVYYGLSLLLLSCNFKPCEKVTDKDVTGYYVPCSSANKNRQYIEILENYSFVMVYCYGDSTIKEWGTWDRYNGCAMLLNVTRYSDMPSEMQDIPPHYGHFTWVRGKLSRGEDYWSFQKVWLKPKLACEK
jgi:hypothetical protein